MARYAIIEDGIVTNLVEATAKFAKSQGWVACPQGDVGWIWDGHAFTPPPRFQDVEAGKMKLHDEINAKRDALEEAVFAYRGKTLDSDPRSVQRINTAVQAAQAAIAAGQPFSIDWTCADDSTLTLDAAGMMGMPVALAMHANAIHQHARSLKTLVDAAETSADLESIDISAGWPGCV